MPKPYDPTFNDKIQNGFLELTEYSPEEECEIQKIIADKGQLPDDIHTTYKNGRWVHYHCRPKDNLPHTYSEHLLYRIVGYLQIFFTFLIVSAGLAAVMFFMSLLRSCMSYF